MQYCSPCYHGAVVGTQSGRGDMEGEVVGGGQGGQLSVEVLVAGHSS